MFAHKAYELDKNSYYQNLNDKIHVCAEHHHGINNLVLEEQ